MIHAVPFHCSTRVLVPAPPAATHIVVEAQLTATSAPGPVSVGLGMTVHDEPFHCSMSGVAAAPCCPTTTQKAAFTQEASKKMPAVTVGVLPTVQVDALRVAGTVALVAPPGVAPRNTHALARTQANAGTAIRAVVFKGPPCVVGDPERPLACRP